MQPIGQVLLEAERISPEDLASALAAQARSGAKLGQILRQLHAINSHDCAWALATQSNLPVVASHSLPLEPVATASLSTAFLQQEKILPLWQTTGELGVAAVDPFNAFATNAIARASKRELHLSVIAEDDFDAVWQRLYGRQATSPASLPETLKNAVGMDTEPDRLDPRQLRELAGDAPVVRLVDDILQAAVQERASDIHFEPFEGRLQVRWRIDGMLHTAHRWPLHLAPAVTSRVKILSGLDIAERRLPQDGGFRHAQHGMLHDIRVSTVPTAWGESVVLRLLDQSGAEADLENLGLAAQHKRDLDSALKLRHGLILVCGPTGSGKTTTLYAGLKQLDRQSRKIVTIEDPVEYRLDGVTQIQVKPDIGLNFATLLRQVVRQDPDIMMVGEIRDVETANIAIQSALTGHLVLSTLHTNSAVAAVTRLREMGIADYLLAATLTLTVGQRLVRMRCPQCQRGVETPAPPAGHVCPVCHGRGYAGRTGIFETVPISAELAHAIAEGQSEAALNGLAYRDGRAPFLAHGRDKIRQGLTTDAELMPLVDVA